MQQHVGRCFHSEVPLPMCVCACVCVCA
jgi:hypothetical protein